MLESALPRPSFSITHVLYAIATLLFGFSIDIYFISERIMAISYIPFMTVLGLYVRSLVLSFFLSGMLTATIYWLSSQPLGGELFMMRWTSFFFTIFIIRTLLQNRRREQENSLNLTIALAETIDARDKYTSYHSQHVAFYSRKIAEAMNLPAKECKNLHVGGLLHDIGKIGVPEAILNKPSRLTAEEFEIIKQHPEIGYNMLQHIPHFSKNCILDMVLHHHERYDGTGYPKGLSGKDIPQVARIMAVADAFDAMVSTRVYRDRKNLSYALEQLESGKGTQFDPEIADVFLRILQEEEAAVFLPQKKN